MSVLVCVCVRLCECVSVCGVCLFAVVFVCVCL